MAMRWVRSSLTLYHQAKLSGFGPALTLGSSIRHGTHPHRRGILPDPMGGRGPRRTPHPQPDPDVRRESMLFGGRCATGQQERSTGFPRLLAGRSSKTVPRWRVSDLAGLAGTVQGSWSSSGLGAVPGSSAELLASHFRRIADSARRTPPPDLRFPRHASMCGPLHWAAR